MKQILVFLMLGPLLPVSALQRPDPDGPPSQSQFRALRLSGQVVLHDGTPAPKETVVQLYCPSGRQPQANVDSKGSFSFNVGGTQSYRMTDSSRTLPSEPVGTSAPDRSHVSMTGCTLRAFLPGYTSSRINLGRRSVFESSEIGTLVLTPGGGAPEALISVNTLSASKKAKKSFEQARKELAKQPPNAEKAAKELEKAVKEYPKFTEAWNLLGEARIRMGDLEGAVAALRKAVDIEPGFAPPYITLTLAELQKGRMAEAAKLAGRAVELEPGLAEAHYYRAVAWSNLGDAAKAEESIRAVHSSPDAKRYPRTHFLLGNILVGKGDVSGAAAEFRRYVELEPRSRAADAVREQLAKWEAEGTLKE